MQGTSSPNSAVSPRKARTGRLSPPAQSGAPGGPLCPPGTQPHWERDTDTSDPSDSIPLKTSPAVTPRGTARFQGMTDLNAYVRLPDTKT